MSDQVWLNLQKCPALCSCFAWSSFVLDGHKLIPWCVVASVLSMLVECQAAVCKKTLALAMPKDKASCNLNLLFFKWCRTIQGLNCKLTYKGLWWLFKSRIGESVSAYCKHRFPFGIWTSYPIIPLNNTVSIFIAHVSGYFPGVQSTGHLCKIQVGPELLNWKGEEKAAKEIGSSSSCVHLDSVVFSIWNHSLTLIILLIQQMESHIPVILSFSLLFKVCNLPFKSIFMMASWEHQRQYKLWRG